jgi:hypothetical protein
MPRIIAARKNTRNLLSRWLGWMIEQPDQYQPEPENEKNNTSELAHG